MTTPTHAVNGVDFGVIKDMLTPLANQAARDVYLAVRAFGLQAGQWGYTELAPGTCLPNLVTLKHAIENHFGGESWEGPQLLIRWPDCDDQWSAVQYEPHADRDSDGKLYDLIVGVALAPSCSPAPQAVIHNVKRPDLDVLRTQTLWTKAGDLTWWRGYVEHAGHQNWGHQPRITVYHRRLR